MKIEWYGQSAFRLEGEQATVFIDPFGDVSALAARGLQWDYPPIQGVSADLLLVTHEHRDHNGVEAIDGDPAVLRSTAGTHESSIGEVIGVASEHDEVAGTQRGPNTIFVFELDGVRIAHFGDFGQSTLRDEQAQAIGSVDLAFLPVGAGPTIAAQQAHEIAQRIGARWIVPMHYRTPRIGFLETADEFIDAAPNAQRLDSASFDTRELGGDSPLVVAPAAP